MRRFLWEHTTFQGEPLEYRGRGIEKLLGALIVFGCLVVPLFGFGVVSALLTAAGYKEWTPLLLLILELGLFYLFGVGLYRSQRYMLSRTAWRGIRGGMRHGGWRYGLSYLKLMLLLGVSLGFASPFVSTRLWNLRMGDAMFGSASFSAEAQWRPLYRRFVFAMLGALVIYALAVTFVITQFGDQLANVRPGAPPPADPKGLFSVILKAYGIIIVAGLAAGFLTLSYHAALLRELFGSLRLDTLGFRFDATTADLLKLYLGNLALVVLTLGLGYLLMPFRIFSFYTRHLATVGWLDTNHLKQTSLTGPGQGDGLADAFDAAAF